MGHFQQGFVFRRPSAHIGPLHRVEICMHAKGELLSEHGVEQAGTLNCVEGWGRGYR